MLFLFFFSSRRRHTRCSRDWSSDVCSSDLAAGGGERAQGARSGALPPGQVPRREAGTPQRPSRGCIRSEDRKSTRLNSSHGYISYAVFCLKKKKQRTVNGLQIATTAMLHKQ